MFEVTPKVGGAMLNAWANGCKTPPFSTKHVRSGSDELGDNDDLSKKTIY